MAMVSYKCRPYIQLLFYFSSRFEPASLKVIVQDATTELPDTVNKLMSASVFFLTIYLQ